MTKSKEFKEKREFAMTLRTWIFAEFVTIILLCGVWSAHCTTLGGFSLKPLPADPSYKTSGAEAEYDGLAPFYNMVRTFISLVLPDINSVIDGKFRI